MKVKKLIKELKKYPGDFNVGVAMHDNLEGELAGSVKMVIEYKLGAPHKFPQEKGNWIVLRC